MNYTDNSKDTFNFFKKLSRGSKHSGKLPNQSNQVILSAGDLEEIQTSTPYFSPTRTNILFLSKRGMSRAPLAREVMRKLLSTSEHFGSIRPSARGISDAYDMCPFDKRMIQFAHTMGYELHGNSRCVNTSELATADLIVPLDPESKKFTQSRTYYIKGEVISFVSSDGQTSPFYISDPFDSEESLDAKQRYNFIIDSVVDGCKQLLHTLASLNS